MSRVQTITFDEWVDMMVLTREQRMLMHDEDFVALICGYEGNGKTTFSIATYCAMCKELNLKPRKDLIFFKWPDYVNVNLAAIAQRKTKIATKILEQAAEDSEIDLKEIEAKLKELKKIDSVERGEFLIYDEAGTQNFARESMSKGNIDQAKLMMANRFLNLFHFWNIPNPSSCDIYTREHRARQLVWIHGELTTKEILWDTKIRDVYLWSKDSYSKIINFYQWKKYFSSTGMLLRQFTPDLRIKDTTGIVEYIPKKIRRYYDAKKVLFNLDLALSMKEDKDDKKDINQLDRMVQPFESHRDWVERTNLDPTKYTAYGGKKEWKSPI